MRTESPKITPFLESNAFSPCFFPNPCLDRILDPSLSSLSDFGSCSVMLAGISANCPGNYSKLEI